MGDFFKFHLVPVVIMLLCLSLTGALCDDGGDDNSGILLLLTGSKKYEVPKTGQTQSDEIGDDGNLQMGHEWPDPRFTDNGDGTITDNLTGLMWEKRPQGGNDGTGDPVDNTWAEALSYCNGLELAEYADWRLPNRVELLSLLEWYNFTPDLWLNKTFDNVELRNYWTSSTYEGYDHFAWSIDLGYGNVEATDKDETPRVWAVRTGGSGAINLPRTGQTTSYADGDDGDLQIGCKWPNPRFTDNGDGTMTDRLTGLMWEKRPHGGNDGDGNASEAVTWLAGIAYCNGLTLAGYDDWRMPNLLELASIDNLAEDFSEWLNGSGFDGVQDDYYWTSTAWVPNLESYAWAISSEDHINTREKTLTSYIWAVRGN